ncbi:MAG: rhodanese-like domain-containing protein [Candidatus Hermodarchaeota archaeon]
MSILYSKKRLKSSLLLLFLALILIALINVKIVAGYTDITSAEAKTALETEDVFLLDVRTLSEYVEGHIPDAYLIPLNELDERMSELPTNFSYPIIVYCRSGSRSAQASGMLDSYGYLDIRNMLGGFNAWLAENYDYETGTTHLSNIISDGSSTDTLSLRLPLWVFAGILFPVMIYLMRKKK